QIHGPSDRVRTPGIGPKAWTAAELGTVASIFSKLPGNDRAALKGIGLQRVKSLPTTRTGSQVWHMQALFAYQLQVAGNTLCVSDEVYDSMASSGGASPEGELSVAHESAHAIESLTARERAMTMNAALHAYNARRDEYNAAKAAYAVAYDDWDVTEDTPALTRAENAQDEAERVMDAAMAEFTRTQASFRAVYSERKV